MCALEQGDKEISAKLFVNVYDLDNDGFIGKADLRQMFLASSMLGALIPPQHQNSNFTFRFPLFFF